MSLIPDFSDKQTLEKYSSAISMSDMEIFVFPELLFPLVISNIMSPIIWAWRDDPWFANIQKKSFTYKVNRIKQYIMEHYVFNLDLDTWGLTTKNAEIERFKEFLTTELSPVVFISFLRYHMNFKKCFQYRHILNGRPHYIALETLFEYE